VSVLGAWRNARGQQEIDELFTALGNSFSDCTSYDFDVRAYDVVGDMAYTAGLEHTSASVDGQPRTSHCGPPRCTAANPASGGSPTATATR
jgi:ketosteroid isomerase-like protein